MQFEEAKKDRESEGEERHREREDARKLELEHFNLILLTMRKPEWCY